MLVKLTALAHPEINGGKPWPMYVDSTRVISVTRSVQQHVRFDRADLKREAYDNLYFGIERLNKLLSTPMTVDSERAEKWVKEMHAIHHEVQDCYMSWKSAYRADDVYPRAECTEIQLACGTALEHGVMLARVWVTESPEDVVQALRRAADGVG